METDVVYKLLSNMTIEETKQLVPIIDRVGYMLEPSLLTSLNNYIQYGVNETFDVYDIWSATLKYTVQNYPVSELLREIQAYSDTKSYNDIAHLCNYVYVLSAFPALYYPHSVLKAVNGYPEVNGTINKFLQQVAEDNNIPLPCSVDTGIVTKSIRHPDIDRFDLDMSFIRFVYNGIVYAAFTVVGDSMCLVRTCKSGYICTELQLPVIWDDVQLFNKIRDIMLNAILHYCGISTVDDMLVPINTNTLTIEPIDTGEYKSGLCKLSDIIRWIRRFNN